MSAREDPTGSANVISLRLAARLLCLSLKGIVILEAFVRRWSCHSSLEGESANGEG